MSISTKQKGVMAAIIIAGVIGIAGVLFTGQGLGSSENAEDEHADHSESEGKREAAAESNNVEGKGAEDKVEDHADEGLVKLTDAQVKASNIRSGVMGSAVIEQSRSFPGEIRFNEDKTAHVVARLGGVVESVRAEIGQQVRKGQTLAIIASTVLSDQRSEFNAAQRRLEFANTTLAREKTLWEQKISAEQDYLQARAAQQEAQIAVQNANQKLNAIGASPAAASLNRFELKAPFDGLITEKHIALGEAVSEATNVFTMSDLTTVWAEFIVSPQDLSAVRVGEKVTISSSALKESSSGVVSYVGSLLGEQTRTARARVTLSNPGMAWRPGLFITVQVRQAQQNVPLAVPSDAIQSVEDKPSIFVKVAEGFKAVPVTLGRTDGVNTEILDGATAGTEYAVTNTFTLKAELGKGSAEHGH
jgi:cobalt-zinc-cadmium efflux system membrane fusion protein